MLPIGNPPAAPSDRPSASPRPGPGETLDRLAGDHWIFQLRRGHRYTTGDPVTAWTAARAQPRATTLLDLGAGVGALGLLALEMLPPPTRVTCVEVQPVSIGLLQKTVTLNRLSERVEILCTDLRQLDLGRRFELITANPPHLPASGATVSPHPQRAAARCELHGALFDSCRAASRHLAPGRRFCLCHAAQDEGPERAVAAAESAG